MIQFKTKGHQSENAETLGLKLHPQKTFQVTKTTKTRWENRRGNQVAKSYIWVHDCRPTLLFLWYLYQTLFSLFSSSLDIMSFSRNSYRSSTALLSQGSSWTSEPAAWDADVKVRQFQVAYVISSVGVIGGLLRDTMPFLPFSFLNLEFGIVLRGNLVPFQILRLVTKITKFLLPHSTSPCIKGLFHVVRLPSWPHPSHPNKFFRQNNAIICQSSNRYLLTRCPMSQRPLEILIWSKGLNWISQTCLFPNIKAALLVWLLYISTMKVCCSL